MQPDRYEVSTAGRRRLSGFIQKRGSKLGMPTWCGFLFGSVFVAVGLCVFLVSVKVLPVAERSVHAPYWVLTAFGVSFALGGFMVWGMVWKQFAANRSRLEATREHPNEPALADYPWHPDGFAVSEWTGAAKALGLAAGLSVFLSMFNWWAFGANGPWMVKGITGLFDLIGVLMWGKAAQQFLRALKFSTTRITFGHFPCRLPEPVVIRWRPSDRITRMNRGTFTLRCVEEWTETHGSGKDRNCVVVHEEVWSANWLVEQPRNIPLNDAVELKYDLPADALPTCLSADKPVFWELQVKLDLPGLDFDETYLVPVYGTLR